MRTCTKCKETKDLDNFYNHPTKSGEKIWRCKECMKFYSKNYKLSNSEYCKEYERSRNNTINRINTRKKYSKTEHGKEAIHKSSTKYSKNNFKKRSAHALLGIAIKNGTINKPSACEKCSISDKKINGHHDDYSKPLIVRWLCTKCHHDWHKENGEGLNG